MIKGKLPVTWSEKDYKDLTWFTNSDHEERFGATVDTTNYKIGVAMCFDEKLLEKFYKAVESLPLEKKVCAVNKVAPGEILPYHTDHYKTYIRLNNISEPEQKDITRIIVFLHDQKAGHQLWIKDKICIGNAGDYFGWGQGTEHMAANLGHEDRYILQVTGLKC